MCQFLPKIGALDYDTMKRKEHRGPFELNIALELGREITNKGILWQSEIITHGQLLVLFYRTRVVKKLRFIE